MRPGGSSGWAVAVVLLLFGACSDDDSRAADAGIGDAGVDGWVLPARESLLAPEVYDCRAATRPPARISTLPLGCYGDVSCDGLITVAHRGGSYFAPENTLSTIRSAIALGIDMVEVDTRLTADGTVVLMHDADVGRTTTGTGDVEDLTLAEIRALTLKIPADLPDNADFSCDRVPTFREALVLCRDRIDVMVDMKEGAVEAARVIAEEQMQSQAVMLASEAELAAARAEVPDLRVMIRPHSHEEIQPLWDAFTPVPAVVHIDPGFDDPVSIDLIHALGAKVLMDMWGDDAYAVMLGDYSGYALAYERGIDIQQSEYAFFALWSVGR